MASADVATPVQGAADPIVPRLLNKAAAARYIGCSEDMVERLVNGGHLSLVELPVSRSARRDTARNFLVDRLEIDGLIPQWRRKRGE